MTEDGPKHPRNPYPSDEEPTQRANLDELLAKHGAASPAGSADFIDDSTLTDVTDIEELMNADVNQAPAAEVPRAVRRKRVQTVMGVAPPPIAAATRPAAAPVPPTAEPSRPFIPIAEVQQPASPSPSPSPSPSQPQVAVRAGIEPQPSAFAVEPIAPVAGTGSADQTAPRRSLGGGGSASSPPSPARVPFSALLGTIALSAFVAAVVALVVVLLFPGARRSAADKPTAEEPATGAALEHASDTDKPPLPAASKALLDRARNGESAAVAELEGRPPTERSIDESLALAEGRSASKRAELAELKKTLSAGGEPDAEAVKKLRNWADDADVAREALGVMASLPGPVSADLVYDAWVGTTARTVATSLAEELIQTRTLREKASPALAVALELRMAKTCDQVGPLLQRALKEGDRRMMPLLGRLTKRKGCGLESDAACAACIVRHGPDIMAAVATVKGRKAPKF